MYRCICLWFHFALRTKVGKEERRKQSSLQNVINYHQNEIAYAICDAIIIIIINDNYNYHFEGWRYSLCFMQREHMLWCTHLGSN